jgi:di-N-acetylchitobiase
LICDAHSRNVRVVPGVFFQQSEANNKTALDTWVKNTVAYVVSVYADGVNFDVEGWSGNRDNLTTLVSETKGAFMNAMPVFHLSFDAGGHTGPSDPGYNYARLEQYVHSIVIMFYDWSNLYSWATANSPLPTDKWGFDSFVALRIPRKRLIAAFPWYGYQFPCQDADMSSPSCNMSRPMMQSVVDYKSIPSLTRTAPNGAIFDQGSASMWMNINQNGQKYQVWFDNPQSLAIKYAWAKSQRILGIGVWHADMLDYSDQSQMAMWNTLDAFL